MTSALLLGPPPSRRGAVASVHKWDKEGLDNGHKTVEDNGASLFPYPLEEAL